MIRFIIQHIPGNTGSDMTGHRQERMGIEQARKRNKQSIAPDFRFG